MGIIFFVLTVLCIPFLASGAEIPRWAFLGVTSAVLLFRIWPSWLQWLLIGYMTLMAVVARNGYDAALLYCHFLFLLILFIYAQRLETLKPVAHGMAIALTINSAVAIAQSYSWFMYDVSGHGALFFNRNMAGEAAAMAMVLVVGYRLWWYIPGLLPTLFWGGRGSILALCVAAALHLWTFNRVLAVLVLPAGSVTAIGIWLLHGDHQDVLQTFDMRLGVIVDLVPHLNLFGHGLGAFIGDFPLYQRHSTSLSIRYDNAHNDLLQVAYDLGIAGALASLVLLARILRAPRSPVWYCLVVFLVDGCVWFPLYKPVTGALAAVCAGCLFARSAPVRDLLVAVRHRIRPWPADHADATLSTGGAVVSPAENPSGWPAVAGDPHARPPVYRPSLIGAQA